MGNFKMSGESMNNLLSDLRLVRQNINEAYDLLEKLMTALDSDGIWSGEQRDAFVAYMKLLQQYHRDFTDKGESNSVAEAVEALESHERRIDSFYDEFKEYKDIL